MPGFNRDTTGATNQNVVYADNVDFSGSTAPTPTVTTDGQLLIGSSVVPNIRVGSLTSTGGSITITPGHGTINLETASGSGIIIIDGNTGSVTGSTVTIETPASTGTLNFSGSGTVLTLNLLDGSNDLAIGSSSISTGGNAIALGTSANATGSSSIVIGNDPTDVGQANSIVIGNTAVISGTASDNICIGTSANSQGGSSISIGKSSITAFGGIAIGDSSGAAQAGSISLGNNATAGSTGSNQAIGSSAAALAGDSTVIGTSATDSAGIGNIVIGKTAVGGSGGSSIIVGISSGNANATGSSNITIGNAGVSAETNTIRIGTQGSGSFEQDACYISGIAGVTVSNTNVVTIDTVTGQLGSQAAGGGGITTINGDTGSVTGSTISIISNVAALGAGSTVQFTGSGTTLTYSNTDGSGNMAIGLLSGNPATTGSRNNAFGFQAQTSVTTGTNNVAVGPFSSFSIADGVGNVSVGDGSLIFTSSGNHNTVVGASAAQGNPGGSSNTAIGYEALQQCNTGNNNTALGFQAAHAYTGAESSNIMISNIGVNGESNVIRIGSQGTGGGQQASCYIAGINNTNSSGFTSPLGVFVDSSTGQLGYGSGGGSGITTINGDTGSATGSTVTLNANSNSGSSVNFSASGATVDLNVTDANFNTIIGTGAGNGSITGTGNVMLGYQAFAAAGGDTNNIGIGYQALNGANGSVNNVAIGLLAASTSNFQGIRNVLIGNNAGQAFTLASNNTGCGYASLSTVNSGGHNTALGQYSLASLTSGSNNIAIGISNTNGGTAYTSSESNNIVIGNSGTVGESSIIRIGTQGTGTGQQNKCYIAGIESATYSAGSPTPALTYCDTSDGQLVSTRAIASATATSTFGSLVVGTGRQNTANYAILVNVSMAITSATGATIVMGVGSTSTPTTNTIVASFSVAETISFSAFVPAGYYMLVNTTGTIVVGSITTQACAVG
jgi:hypothetical protein